MHSSPPPFLLLVLAGWLAACGSGFAISTTDINAAFSAYNSAFYYQNGTNAYFKDTQAGGAEYFWGQAEEIECVLDTYEWTANPACPSMITNLLNGFLSNNGSSWSYNKYNDDLMWAIIAFARGGMDTGRTNYCNIAKANFDTCFARAWDSTLGGGLWWTTDKDGKNACVNGPGSIAAYLLYKIYNDTNYWHKATNIYAWERAVLFNTNSGAICDNISSNGVLGTWASTYNQGTFIGAANFLDQTNDATLAAHFTLMSLTSSGILPEYGIAGNNSGFNAIFLRWMTRFMKARGLQYLYEPWLQTNAAAAWNLRRTADNLSWCQWLHPSPALTNFDSWDCISSFEALQAADPTQTSPAQPVPTDPIGFWRLDETGGATAADASGNANTGTVSGAAWSTSGRINGCLNFNGSSSSVQVTRPLVNDFTIAFWVKTTQTAGTGQWYNGVGLIDGDASGTANDFGTALCGGKLAFGIGNPDTTILSAVRINDGAWHQCVATRQQATGAIRVYVDGALQGSGTASLNSLSSSPRLLFGAIASGFGFFSGSLDEIKLFARTLSAGEVAGLYNSSVTPPPAPPSSLTATAGNLQVLLSWPAASAATSYNLKRSLVSGGPYATLTNVATTSCTDTSATNNRTCYYVVSAVNAAGESTNSSQSCATPVARSAWFKADAITGLNNGAPVSTWPDASGNGFNAVQLLASNQPTFVTAALNSLPAVRFNSANSTWLWLPRPVQDGFTIILVYKSTQGISTGIDFWNGAGLINGEQGGTVNDFGISLNASGQILAGTGNPDTTLHSATGLNNGSAHVVSFKRTRSSGALVLYVDGAQVASGTGGTQSLTSPGFLMLGAQGTLNNFLTGDLAEVQIFNAALSATDRLGQETALKCKYALSGGAAPAPPTALAATVGNRQIALNWVLSAGATGYNLWRSTNSGSTYQLAAAGLTNSSYLDTAAVSGLTNSYRLTAADACGAGSYSDVTNVFLPLPALGMTPSAGSLALTWPGWANDWTLCRATNLTPPVLWLPVTNVAGSNNGLFSLSLPTASGSQFFRLVSP